MANFELPQMAKTSFVATKRLIKKGSPWSATTVAKLELVCRTAVISKNDREWI